MRKIFACCILSASFAAFAQAAYNVKVETYLAGKLDDKFEFVVKEGSPQEKGYDGRYLAKRYLAKGFPNTSLTLKEEAQAEKEAAEAEEKKSFEDRLSGLLMGARAALSSAEVAVGKANDRIDNEREKVKMLEEIEALLARSEAQAKAKFKEFEQKYSLTAQDRSDAKKLARLRKLKYQDFEEFDVGSYCKMSVVKVLNKRQVRFNISYAYSKLMSMQYHDGKNSDNSITKYPIFEIYERLNTPAKITLGKPYCIQFTRPKSILEAKTVQEAMSKSSLFSGAAAVATDSSAGAQEIEKPRGELDAKGSYEKIKAKYQIRTGETLRAVFTVTAVE